MPFATLFLLSSLDGKISTGSIDERDFDLDFPKISGLKEGLQQYYDAESNTDLWSLNSGRVLSKVGVNTWKNIQKIPVTFVVVDNSHITHQGIMNLIARTEKTIIVTSNLKHPSFKIRHPNLKVLYQRSFNPVELFKKLSEYGCDSITVQTGSTLNSIFLRAKLIDRIHLIIAPVIVGGEGTAGICGGQSFMSVSDLNKLSVLKLNKVKPLNNSYVEVVYSVI